MIPSHIRLTSKVTYRTLFTEKFKQGDRWAECVYHKQIVVLHNNRTEEQLFWDFFHEMLHAVSVESCGEDLHLTEAQVTGLERGFRRVAKLNGWTGNFLRLFVK
jgi:hypothetical protein